MKHSERIRKFVGSLVTLIKCPKCQERGGVYKLYDAFRNGHVGYDRWCYFCGFHWLHGG